MGPLAIEAKKESDAVYGAMRMEENGRMSLRSRVVLPMGC